MTASRRLSEAFRHLSALLASHAVRAEDQVRKAHRGGPVEKRAAQVRSQVTAWDKKLGR